MSYNNNSKSLLTTKAEVSIKSANTWYKLDSLQDISINLTLQYEYIKETDGSIAAFPVQQISDFSFTIPDTTDLYDGTGNDSKTISYFTKQLSDIPPKSIPIEFKVLSEADITTDNMVTITHTGVIESITHFWDSTMGIQKVTIQGRIITPGTAQTA